MDIAILIWLGMGIIAGVIGSNRGDNGCGWFILGVLLGPIGILLAFFAKGKDQREIEKARKGRSKKMKICPKCAEPVQKMASVCKHCGHEFSLESMH
jgi:hypothetical protein